MDIVDLAGVFGEVLIQERLQNPHGQLASRLVQVDGAVVLPDIPLHREAAGGTPVLQRLEQLHPDGVDGAGRPYGIGRVGVLEGIPVYLPAFAQRVKEVLGAAGVRYVDARRPVRRVAVGGGACGDMLSDAVKLGCDTFVTSDVKYNVFLDAKALGVNLIDAGHYATEQVVCPVLVKWLQGAFPDLEVVQSARHREVYACL